MVKQGVTNDYMDALQKTHAKAAQCTSDMSKLAMALTESKLEAGQFFATTHWENIMAKLGTVPDLEWQEDIDTIMKEVNGAIVELLPTMTSDELAELINTPMTREKLEEITRDPASGDGASVQVRNVNTASKNLVKLAKGCNGKASCLLSSGLLEGVFKIFGNSLDSAEAQRNFKYAEWSMGTYAKAEQILMFPKKIKTALATAASCKSCKYVVAGKNAKMLSKMKTWEKRFESITYIKLYDTIGDFKKAKIDRTIKTFRKAFQTAVTKVLNNKVVGTLVKLSKKFGTAVMSQAAKLGAWFGAKAAGKVATNAVLTTAGTLAGKIGLSVLDLGMAIWDMVDGIKSLSKGSPVAKKFRIAAGKLENVHFENEETLANLVNECMAENSGTEEQYICAQMIGEKHGILGCWL